jgi:cephalosporin hydroxylase
VNTWFGVPIQQLPFDLYLYQEVIARRTPDYIIQTGVFDGGSALYLAHMLDLAQAPDSALVVAVDIELRESALRLNHPRIRLIEGSSTSSKTIAEVDNIIAAIPVVNGGMVSLDSDHSAGHVAAELEIYPKYVGLGNYLVVEDTNVNGHPVSWEHGLGPFEALEAYIKNNREFEADDELWQRQMISFHNWGWLKRIRLAHAD